jgi:hypothetical protein
MTKTVTVYLHDLRASSSYGLWASLPRLTEISCRGWRASLSAGGGRLFLSRVAAISLHEFWLLSTGCGFSLRLAACLFSWVTGFSLYGFGSSSSPTGYGHQTLHGLIPFAGLIASAASAAPVTSAVCLASIASTIATTSTASTTATTLTATAALPRSRPPPPWPQPRPSRPLPRCPTANAWGYRR